MITDFIFCCWNPSECSGKRNRRLLDCCVWVAGQSLRSMGWPSFHFIWGVFHGDFLNRDLPPTSVRRGCNAITSADCTSMEKFQGHKLRTGAWFYRRQPGVSCLISQKGTSPKSISPMQVSLIPEVTSEDLVKVCHILALFVQWSSARSTAVSCLPRSLWRQGPSSLAS